MRWNFRSAVAVNAFWKKFQRVPARKRRTKRDEERYCLALYLLALATHRRLKYPLRIEEGESPNFTITGSSGKATCLEVIKASEMWVEHEVSNGNGKADCFAFVRRAIERKLEVLAESRVDAQRDLLVYQDTPLPAIDRPKALVALNNDLGSLKRNNPLLGRVSIIISLDVVLDSGRDFHVLPFVDWSEPQAFSDFGERIEFEGKKAAVTQVRKHLSEGRAIYSLDRHGQIVKRMPDALQFKAEAKPQDEERIAGAIRS